MNKQPRSHRRRRLIQVGTALGIGTLLPFSTLASLVPTARQPRGPFYPDELPLDRDNDLVRLEGREESAAGEITELTGRVLDPNNQPIPDALVEIWQCDANGRYIHQMDRRLIARDPGFQGYGRFTTRSDGQYRFRTIKPVPYPGRAPHIHFAVRAAGRSPLITQMYVRGAPENRRDWLLNAVRDEGARERLIVAFEPAEQPGPATLAARFDIVLA